MGGITTEMGGITTEMDGITTEMDGMTKGDMMKRIVLFLAALLLLSVPLMAATAAWTQPGDTLANIQAYVYTLTVNGAAPVTLVATCVQPVTTNPVACTAPVTLPVVAPGATVTFALTATDSLGSSVSAPLVLVMPTTPTGLGIH